MVTAPGLASALFGEDDNDDDDHNDGGDRNDRPPDREWILKQGFIRDPVKTKQALPDQRLWPPEFDRLPVIKGRIRVD